ncbi:MAG: response regulator [Desulfovibrionales bacterium]
MKILIVEDDFISRRILHKILLPYGQCDIAVDGIEAIQAFEYAWKDGKPYDLICLDIMMPKVDGFNALKKIRELELNLGVEEDSAAKVIITTALKDPSTIVDGEFANFANSYIVKPITKQSLLSEISNLGIPIE